MSIILFTIFRLMIIAGPIVLIWLLSLIYFRRDKKPYVQQVIAGVVGGLVFAGMLILGSAIFTEVEIDEISLAGIAAYFSGGFALSALLFPTLNRKITKFIS